MQRREMLQLFGLAAISTQVANAQGTGSMTFYNYTATILKVFVNYSEQCPVDAWQSAVYPLELGDHRIDVYRGTNCYSYNFRLSRTTPCRDLTVQDSDF